MPQQRSSQAAHDTRWLGCHADPRSLPGSAIGHHGAMPIPPARLKAHVAGHLDFHASKRWPQLEEVTIRWHGGYCYVNGYVTHDKHIPLCRLRYLGSDTTWGFALYQASTETYHDTLLPSGSPTGTPEEALDCALGLYLADPTAWINPRRINAPLH